MYKESQVILIAAYAANRLFATHEGIPWKNDPDCCELVRDDIRHLREKIKWRSVIMGRKTYEEISAVPGDPILTKWNSQIVVMSRDPMFETKHKCAAKVSSLEEALERCSFLPICILGGLEVYQESLRYDWLVDRMELTVIDKDFGSDGLCFPPFSQNDWNLVNNEARRTSSGVNYSFVSYERR